jgi:DNA-binding GntR family transcriptional regulator
MPLSYQFHWASFRGAGAPMLSQIVERLWETTHSYRRVYFEFALKNAERMEIMRVEREMLFGAVVRRETDLAPRLLSAHIRRSHMGLLEFGETIGAFQS